MKQLPNNTKAEKALMAAVINGTVSLDDLPPLSFDDFYSKKHQLVFQAIMELHQKLDPIDLYSVGQKSVDLNGGNDKENIVMDLMNIFENAPIALNPVKYAKIIRNLSVVRDVIKSAMQITDAGFECGSDDAEDFVGEAQSKILALKTSDTEDRFYSMVELMSESFTRIEDAQNGKREIGLNIGLPSLSPLFDIYGSKLILIAGRPGMGKTALSLSIAKFLAEQGKKIGFVSIEMDKESLADRLLSVESNTNALCFYQPGYLKNSVMQKIDSAARYLSGLPLLVDDSHCNISDLERKCRRMKKEGCEAIFIDQLSKIKGKAGASKFDTYTDHCSQIAMLKKELRIPIFLLCQLNRNVEARANKRPELSDLKQTGMLEEDADMVFLIYRPGYYNQPESDSNVPPEQTEIILAKNRSGATGSETNVPFNPKRGMFHLAGVYNG